MGDDITGFVIDLSNHDQDNPLITFEWPYAITTENGFIWTPSSSDTVPREEHSFVPVFASEIDVHNVNGKMQKFLRAIDTDEILSNGGEHLIQEIGSSERDQITFSLEDPEDKAIVFSRLVYLTKRHFGIIVCQVLKVKVNDIEVDGALARVKS